MQKVLKIVPIVILILSFMIVFPTKIEATGMTWDSVIQKGNNFINQGKARSPVDENKVANVMLPIGQFWVGVGIFVMVVVTIIMGIKYMSAPDPNTQAKLKQQLIGIVVAGVVIFGAYGIWTLVYNFMDGLF